MLLFLGLLGVVFEATRRGVRLLARRRGQEPLELMGRGLFVGAAGMLTAFFFLSAEYREGALADARTAARLREHRAAVASQLEASVSRRDHRLAGR